MKARQQAGVGLARKYVAWIMAMSLLLASSAWCAQKAPPSGIAQMNHRAWVIQDGAPADIWAMAQGKDGFVWLGTGSGLFRFDGVEFERYAPSANLDLPATDITALMQDADGDMWMGFLTGEISRIEHGRLVNYSARDGLPDGTVFCFGQTGDGAVWAATTNGLVRYRQGRWEKIGADWNYPYHRATWILVDHTGTTWVATGSELVSLRKGAHRFEHTGIAVGAGAVLAESPEGTLWLSDELHGTRALPGLSAEHVPPALTAPLPRTDFARSKRMLFDRSGALWGTLWAGKGRGGVYRVADPARLATGQSLQPDQLGDIYDTSNGLTSVIAVPLLQDQEGSVWVGTNFGLNRFHANAFHVVSPMAGESPANAILAASGHGMVWIAQAGNVYQVQHGVPVLMATGLPLVDKALADRHGVWLVASDGFHWLDGKAAPQLVPMPEQADRGVIYAMAVDQADHLWISAENRGLLVWSGSAWQSVRVSADKRWSEPRSVTVDSDGSMWFGYQDNRVAHWRNGQLRPFTAHDGLDVGNVLTIDVDGSSILVGGERGLARLQGDRFQSISTNRNAILSGISGIVRAAQGDIWINGSAGIVRIKAEQMQRAFDDPAYDFQYKLFDCDDGVPGIAIQQQPVPSITPADDGKLWFFTNQGVSWIDPAQVQLNTVAPKVAAQWLLADGKRYLPGAALVLPPHTRTVTLGYTAASYLAPQRVNFRYRLYGVDAGWQDAGHQREAIYANLAPGRYRFDVTAANDDGFWSKEGASMSFQIQPAFYQTRWFLLLCALASVFAAWSMFRAKVRQVEMRLKERLEVRHAERERIARELHDTLLQGFQGLILRFHAITQKMLPNDPVRGQIEQALDRADGVLVEGRDKVRDLRLSAGITKDLAGAFIALGEELFENASVKFRVITTGKEQQVDPAIREEVYLIGREAMLNAFHHAQALALEVQIDFELRQLRMCVRDDGVGIDAQTLDAGHRPGHWGLVGMRERARCMGGQLHIWSAQGSGTEVELTVPGSIAYAHKRKASSVWMKRLLGAGRSG